MKVSDFRFPDDLYYDENHQWVSAADGIVTIGVTDYSQGSAGDIVFVELPQRGAVVQKGRPIGSIESGKWVGRIYASVSGTVLKVNELLRREPRSINRDPYGTGWIAKIEIADPSELQFLIRWEAARAFVEAELEKERLTAPIQGEVDEES